MNKRQRKVPTLLFVELNYRLAALLDAIRFGQVFGPVSFRASVRSIGWDHKQASDVDIASDRHVRKVADAAAWGLLGAIWFILALVASVLAVLAHNIDTTPTRLALCLVLTLAASVSLVSSFAGYLTFRGVSVMFGNPCVVNAVFLIAFGVTWFALFGVLL